MTELKITSDFTIEDIHKIRENDYEQTRGMSLEDLVAHLNAPAKIAHSILGEAKKSA